MSVYYIQGQEEGHRHRRRGRSVREKVQEMWEGRMPSYLSSVLCQCLWKVSFFSIEHLHSDMDTSAWCLVAWFLNSFIACFSRCAKNGYTSRWYHLSCGEHFCNECFDHYYRRWETQDRTIICKWLRFLIQPLLYWLSECRNMILVRQQWKTNHNCFCKRNRAAVEKTWVMVLVRNTCFLSQEFSCDRSVHLPVILNRKQQHAQLPA